MSLVRTSFWNGIAVAVRVGAGLVLNKILAVYVGPAGYATMGQFQNAMSVAMTFATGAVSTGVTKITAEHFDDAERQRALWRTAGTVVIGAALISAAFIVAFRRPLARTMLNDEALSGTFIWLAASLTFISLNALLLAIFNGKKDVRRYVVSNIAGSILALGVIGALTWRYGLYGALVALSVYQGVTFFVTVQQALSAPWFSLRCLVGPIDRAHLKSLGHFMVMAATSAAAVPLSQTLIRQHLGTEIGWDFAGYWDAMWRISTIYLTLVTTTLTLYWLPRIAEIRTWPELRAEIWQTYRLVLPLVIMAAVGLFLARDIVIQLLFTPKFAQMRELFAWQLAGDVVKIASWIVAFVMVGKGLTKTFVMTEIAAAVMFVGYTVIFVRFTGFNGVSIAHFSTYLSYLLLVSALTLSTERRRAALFR